MDAAGVAVADAAECAGPAAAAAAWWDAWQAEMRRAWSAKVAAALASWELAALSVEDPEDETDPPSVTLTEPRSNSPSLDRADLGREAALSAEGPGDETDPSRPAAPALPTDAWALIMDRAPSCRCGRARGGWPISSNSFSFVLLFIKGILPVPVPSPPPFIASIPVTHLANMLSLLLSFLPLFRN